MRGCCVASGLGELNIIEGKMNSDSEGGNLFISLWIEPQARLSCRNTMIPSLRVSPSLNIKATVFEWPSPDLSHVEMLLGDLDRRADAHNLATLKQFCKEWPKFNHSDNTDWPLVVLGFDCSCSCYSCHSQRLSGSNTVSHWWFGYRITFFPSLEWLYKTCIYNFQRLTFLVIFVWNSDI